MYGAVLVAALTRVWASRRDWRHLRPLYLLFASLTAVYSVFFIHTRYRMVLEPFLLVLAAHGLAVLAGGMPRLGVTSSREKLEGSGDIWKARITQQYRFTFQVEGDTCLLRRIGPHDIERNP